MEKVSDTWRVVPWTRNTVTYPGIADTQIIHASAGGVQTETWKNSSGSDVLALTTKTFGTGAWSGFEMVQSSKGQTGSAPFAVNYTYKGSTDIAGVSGQVNTVTSSDGNWTRYDYYENRTVDYPKVGLRRKMHRPFLDTPSTAPSFSTNTLGVVTEYDYNVFYLAGTHPLITDRSYLIIQTASQIQRHDSTVTAQTSVSTPTVSTRNGFPVVTSSATDYANASTGLTTVTTRYAPTADSQYGYMTGLPHSIKRPDGTMTAYAYIRGTPSTNFFYVVPVSNGTWMQIVRIEGHTDAGSGSGYSSYGSWALESDLRLEAGRSMAYVEVRSSGGLLVSQTRNVWSGSGWVTMERNLNQHEEGLGAYRVLTQRDHGAAPFYTVFTQGFSGGFAWYRTDETGVQHQFVDDALGRLIKEVKVSVSGQPNAGPIWTHYGYDSAGRLTSTRIAPADVADNAAAHALTTWKYDAAGRKTETKVRAVDGTTVGMVTTTHVPVYSGNYRIQRQESADGSEIFQEVHSDGSHKATWGSGTRSRYSFYSKKTDGRIETTTSATNSPTGMSWGAVWADWLGRTVRQIQPNTDGTTSYEEIVYGSGGGGCSCASKVVSRQWFNAVGTPLLAAQRFTYDALGDLASQGQDLNNNATLDLNSSDRVSTLTYSVETLSGKLWKVVDKKTYSKPLDSSTYILETVMERLSGNDGTNRQLVRSFDAKGNMTETVVKVTTASALVLTETTVPGSTTTAKVEVRNGFKALERASTGVQRAYTYDGLGRVSRVQGRDEVRVDYVYFGGTAFVAAVRNAYLGWAGNEWQEFVYDKMGRVTVHTTKTGNTPATITRRKSYTTRGEVYRQWGSADNPAEYTYDAMGRVVTMSTFRNTAVNWDNATWPTGGTANTTTWTYHAASGLLTATTDALSRATTFTYNNRRQVVTQTVPRASSSSVVKTFLYAETTGARTGELLGFTYSDGTAAVTYSYDHNGGHSRLGRPTGITDATGTRWFGYRLDDGQLDYEWLDHGFYGYNVATGGRDVIPTYATSGVIGRPTGYKTGWGSQQDSILSVTFGYDGATGRINTVTSGGGFGARAFTYAYQSGGSEVTTITSGLYSRSRSWQTWRDQVDIDEVWYNGVSKSKFSYNYDWLERKTDESSTGERATLLSWSLTNGLIHGWEYDSRSQVTKTRAHARSSGGTADPLQPRYDAWREWDYDPMGNRLQEKRGSGSWEAWGANALNQITQTGASSLLGTPTHDYAGNVTEDNEAKYAYDGENRLKSLEVKSSGKKYLYTYDYQGRRVRKQQLDGGSVVEKDTRYIYAGWQLVAELDGLNINGAGAGNVQRRYAWGLDAMGTVGGAGGTGALLMVKEGESGGRYFAITDARQNVRGYMDESGTVVNAREYSANGEVARESGSYTASPIGYASLYRDAETGMSYHHHRYYHPKMGRFINRDPIGLAGGLNLYGYVGNNAVNFWDLLGMLPPVVVDGGNRVTVTEQDTDGCLYEVTLQDMSSDPGYEDFHEVGRTLIACPPSSDGGFGGGGSSGGGGGGSSVPGASSSSSAPNNPPNQKICDYLYKEMATAMKRFDGQHRMSQVRRGLMAEMGGARSMWGDVGGAVWKDTFDMVAGGAADFFAPAEAALGAGMAYTSVNTFYEGGTNFAAGDYFNGTMETVTNAGGAVQYAGRLSGARWAARGIPGLNAVSLGYDIGTIAIKGALAGFGAKWHNGEFNRLNSAFQDSLAGMDLELGTMDDLMRLLKENGCK